MLCLAYRASRTPFVQPPLRVDAREIYHSLCPLPYLSPIPKLERPSTIDEQAENEAAYRQLLVQGVLAVLLPTEDLENECLTSLVGQILSELIIGGVVVKKASEPWMIWSGLAILADVMGRRRHDAQRRVAKRKGGAMSGAKGFSVSWLLWSLLHYIFAVMTFIRIFVTTVATSRSLPLRGQNLTAQKDKPATTHHDPFGASDRSPGQLPWDPVRTPILAFCAWPTMSNLLKVDCHMPWLLGCLSMVQWVAIAGPGRIAGYNGLIDR